MSELIAPQRSELGHNPTERLIKIDDEELGVDEPEKHKQRPGSIPNAGVHFTINGRHIQMNPKQLKYLSLVTLTVQNAALGLTMRAANTQKEHFSKSIAVTMAELMKLVTCVLLIYYEEFSIQGTKRALKTHIVNNYTDTLKVSVPAFVYYLQNNLLYVGSANLDAATNQVTYQLKILTTAFFSMIMLNKRLNKLQWTALVVLFIGVALIETIVVNDHPNSTNTPAPSNHPNQSAHTTLAIDIERHVENPLLGFVAVLMACFLSGFAGVYFEKILKSSGNVSLWIRNVQLSIVAIAIGLLQIVFLEYEFLLTKGPLYGFTPLTWFCIVLQAQGGLLVAVVVKFANNILKGFATSMAIVISTIASIFLFDFNLTPSFMLGASMVIGSVMMYSKQ